LDGATDADLMARVRGGDQDAFAAIVDRYKDAVVGYISRLTGSRDRADEIGQETFVRLYRTAQRYDERGRLAPYLYRIATNLLRTEEIRARRRRFLLLQYGAYGDRCEDTAERRMLADELARQVQDAIAILPLRYRAPVVLRDIEGWSYQDIARALGCHEGTVKSRIARGRDCLRRALAPYRAGTRKAARG
jgi:RNA polymerase sigma-70 factor, ECF subfamily